MNLWLFARYLERKLKNSTKTKLSACYAESVVCILFTRKESQFFSLHDSVCVRIGEILALPIGLWICPITNRSYPLPQELVQGITLAGVFFDEVALMPQSFVNQATARCSVDGSKFWFNCNPAGPSHWFKTEWIDKINSKRLLYLHFLMDDNLSLSDKIKEAE